MTLPPPLYPLRVNALNDSPLRSDGRYVLYWMIAARRPRYNFALERALELGRQLDRPVLVFEPLRIGYRWASDRIHRYVLDGMKANHTAFMAAGVRHYPYVEPEAGAGKGLLEALAEHACAVVTDEFPCFFLPRMVRAAGERLSVYAEQVDGNGLMPLRAAERVFTTAASFRRHLHKTLPDHLGHWPMADPLVDLAQPMAEIPEQVSHQWPMADLADVEALIERLPIDHTVAPVAERGGFVEGTRAMSRFIEQRLSRYGDDRNHPDEAGASQLSGWLHFGHVSAHEVVKRIFEAEDWSPARLGPKPTGKREGWWGLSAPAEAFMDEIVTWREVGFTFTFQRPDDYDQFESLPAWALTTLAEHADDERPHLYTLEQLDSARTHDEIWNAAQRQLKRDGRIHNYLRMLWGKKILQWSPTPQMALERLIELNNRYAIDGRDPNSYSGIFWVLGRFDRAWGPVRPIFGKVRYMTSESTAKKVRLKKYLHTYRRL
ncbi:MAG: deoxyribodipyrimidine photolyase [Bradymonadia bacterium]